MTREREQWQQVEQLFYETLDLPAEKRSAFLDRACSTEESLRKEVESLLAASEKTAGFLRRPAEEVARRFVRETQFDRIGAYRILNLLGQGGMGKVYLAERADQSYRQLVAIKLMQTSGLSRPEMVARFRTERQILANLEHPNIARLLDGGMTPEGHPYLVMEFIDGRPVNEYSPGSKLSIAERLKLFRAICSAVEYAHGRLVVHRDIKPGNILVTSNGTPKLLDFGIAKFLDPENTDAREPQTAERLMTFEYASPEQVRGDAATTLTDVYALGVLLYQLLTGVLPFRFETSSPLEAAKVICEKDPLPPSVAAANSGATSSEIRALQGDLDSIAMKAMRKEPQYRYQSAIQLSADIDAYLQGYPVLARTGSWNYQAGKFVRRHRTAVGASAVLALALVAFAVAMGFLARRATREQMIAARESQFLASVLEASTPGHAPDQAVTALELLDQGAQRIHHEFSEAPDAHASLISTMARAYTNLGRTDRATELAEECYRICLKTYGENSPLLLPAIHLRATLLRDDGKYADSEPLFRREIALTTKTGAKDDLAMAGALTDLGEDLYWEGKDAEAESTLRQALALDRSRGPNLGSDARNYLALVVERKGAYSEAAELLREAIEIDARSKGTNSPEYLASLHNLANDLIELGDIDGAEAKLHEDLAGRRTMLGSNNSDLTYSLNGLVNVLLEKGDWRSAAPLAQESLALGIKHLGPAHPRMVSVRNNWARVLQEKGDYAAAEEEYRRALDILAQTHASESWASAATLSNLGLLDFDRGKYAAAEQFARQGLEIRRKLGGENTPDYAASLINLAETRMFQQDAPGAEPLLREALAILQRRLSPGHPSIIAAQVRLGEAILAQGHADRAEAILTEGLRSARSAPYALASWRIAEAESAQGACLSALGRFSEAKKLLGDANANIQMDPRPVLRQQAAVRLKQLMVSES